MHCVICGKEISKSMFTNKILCSSECYQIDFWDEFTIAKNDPQIARIKGEQYYICDEGRSGFKGFCGRRFCIRFFDGREITSTNLWYNGVIPESHRGMLLDNAEFIEDKDFEVIKLQTLRRLKL